MIWGLLRSRLLNLLWWIFITFIKPGNDHYLFSSPPPPPPPVPLSFSLSPLSLSLFLTPSHSSFLYLYLIVCSVFLILSIILLFILISHSTHLGPQYTTLSIPHEPVVLRAAEYTEIQMYVSRGATGASQPISGGP